MPSGTGRHPVAQHDHLDRQFVLAASREPDQLSNADEEEVEERECHGAIVAGRAAVSKDLATAADDILGTQRP
ncbi:MAG: hypothetical protein ACYDGN_04605 [Acidimicrobiales bacterium]